MGHLYDEDDEEEELLGDEVIGLRQKHAYLPYSHWRIKQILDEYLNARLERHWEGYKGTRHMYEDPWFVPHYSVIRNGTDEVISPNITLYQLRSILANNDFPLNDPLKGRSKGAELFMEVFNHMKEEKEKEIES